MGMTEVLELGLDNGEVVRIGNKGGIEGFLVFRLYDCTMIFVCHSA